MKIYYVGRNSKAKGPAYLRLADNGYLEAWDICIVNTDETITAYLLTDEQRSWSDCKLIIRKPISIKEDWSNMLLYSYNGLCGRKGNILALETLLELFRQTVLGPLFEESIKILKFQKDLFEVSILYKIYQKVAESNDSITGRKKQGETQQTEGRKQMKYFIYFLKPWLVDEVRPLLRAGKSINEVLKTIRKEYPKEFREAFIEFNRFNPSSEIHEGFEEILARDRSNAEEYEEIDTQNGSKNYEKLIINLNVNKTVNKLSPHKPLLLLAVMEQVEKGEIVSPFIPISRELEETFKQLWEKYVPTGEGHQCTMQNPFFYMRSEGFWRLKPLPWHEEKTSYSLKDLRRNYYGAIIDEELYEAFCDQEKRAKFREMLLSTYLSIDNKKPQDPDADNLKPEPSFDSETEANQNFAEPISTWATSNGIRMEEYSKKSLAVYGNVKHLTEEFKDLKGRFNPYLRGGAGWIFSKKRKKELLKLLGKVENDSIVTFKGRNDALVSEKSQSETILAYGSKIVRLQGNGFSISNPKNSSEVLLKFVEAVGIERVYALKIVFLGGYLVDRIRNRNPQYQSSCKYIEGGYWLNCMGTVAQKIDQIQEIARRLGIAIEIEVCK